jgi:DNA-binding GntR family transcriptional regulator
VKQDDSAFAVPIDKRSLTDQVADHIRDLIIEGRLVPGARIDEAAMIERLGVSRTPFREALRTLAAEGLVDLRPSRGAVVRKLSAKAVLGTLEVLAHLERLAGERACVHATDAQIAELLAVHARMAALHARRDRLPYYKLNQAFHNGLAAAADNAALHEVQGNLQARLKRIRYIGNRKPEYWDAAMREHEEMAAALRARDGKRLGEAMATHLMRTWDRVRDVVMESDGSEETPRKGAAGS